MAGQTAASADQDEALARAVQAVYAVEPGEFVATRKEWVARLRAEGMREVAKQVGALRKPSVSAAAVNALVRADDPVVTRLREVGEKMRHAQATLDAPALAALRDDRDEVLAAWVAAAREHAAATLTAAVEAEVRDTAVAALADPAATEVATSGSLTRALSYSGFGEVDVADAVARTSTGVVLTRIEGGGREEEASDPERAEPSEDELADDTDADADAVTDADDEEQVDDDEVDDEEVDDTADDEDAADVAALEMELDEAEKVVAATRAGRRTAVKDHEAAEERLASAAEQVAQAQRLLAAAQKALEEAQKEQSRTAAALEDAEEQLRNSRRRRDTARAALEEAEDQ